MKWNRKVEVDAGDAGGDGGGGAWEKNRLLEQVEQMEQSLVIVILSPGGLPLLELSILIILKCLEELVARPVSARWSRIIIIVASHMGKIKVIIGIHISQFS